MSESNIALTPTDLPAPVVPATNRCGILVKSKTTGIPEMSFPKARGKVAELSMKLS